MAPGMSHFKIPVVFFFRWQLFQGLNIDIFVPVFLDAGDMAGAHDGHDYISGSISNFGCQVLVAFIDQDIF